MKKMLFKNWFWIIILIVLGIKYGTAQGLTPVKKYDLPEIVKETDTYIVENIKDFQYKITVKSNRTVYYIDYQDYQDVIEFFQQLILSEPTAENYRYEAQGKHWSITIAKFDDLKYFGRLGYESGNKIKFITLYLEDVLFLASLPIDIWE